MTPDEATAWEFLDLPYWFSGPHYEEWKEQCLALGRFASAVFLQALKAGTAQPQYTALYAIRLHDYEAVEEGYGSETIYKVKAKGEEAWQYLRSAHPPEDPPQR